MASLTVDDLVGPAIVTVAAAVQFGSMAGACGKARRLYKVTPPQTEGPPEFNRIFRAYMNSVEFLPMFLSIVWVNSFFCHQVMTLVLGLLYVFFRQQYFTEYSVAAKAREGPFRRCILIIRVLAYSAIAGIALHLVKRFAGLDVVAMAKSHAGM